MNATGLNVTGILQASEIRTTQPMEVSNLTVSGKIKASLYDSVEFQNMADIQKFVPAEIYSESSVWSRSAGPTYTYNETANYPVQQYVTVTDLTLRADGNATSLLTEMSTESNPVALDKYENPAPLVKINDDGTLTYLDASAPIMDICNELLPTNLDTFKIRVSGYSPTVPGALYYNSSDDTGNVIGLVDFSEITARHALSLLKRGFAVQDTTASTPYVFFNHNLSPNDPAQTFNQSAFHFGIDLRPFVAGHETANVYLSGGISREIAPAFVGYDYSNLVTIPPFTVSVTTDSVEYMNKKDLNQNAVYFNRNLNVLNFNLVDLSGYTSEFPTGNYTSSNVITISPVSFTGSFGFYKNIVPLRVSDDALKTFPTTAMRFLDNPNVAYTEKWASTPALTTIQTAEFMMQTSDELVFTYNISNQSGLQTNTINRRYNTIAVNYQYEPVDLFAPFMVPKFEYGLGVNASIHIVSSSAADEILGYLYTHPSSNVGYNRNTPYLPTLKNGCSAHSLVGSSLEKFIKVTTFTDLTHGPDDHTNLTSSNAFLFSWDGRMQMVAHEAGHVNMFSIGLNSKDGENNIFDDETIAAFFQSIAQLNPAYDGTTYTSDLVIVSETVSGLSHMARGRVPLSVSYKDSRAGYVLAGTSFQDIAGDTVTGDYAFVNSFSMHIFLMRILKKYDPNAQHVKLYLWHMAQKLTRAKFTDLMRGCGSP